MKKYIVLSIFALISLAINASPVVFSHLTISDGLKNNRVSGIVQDSIGFIWLATHDGVDRYDGTHLAHYSFPNDNIFNSVIYSKKHGLFFGTNTGGVYQYCVKEDSFSNIIFNNSIGSNIQAMYACENKLFIGASSGLYIHDLSSGRLEKVSYDEHLNITSIVNVGRDIFVGTNKGVKFLERQTTLMDTQVMPRTNVSSMEVDGDSVIFVGTRFGMVYKLLKVDGEWTVGGAVELGKNKNKRYPINSIEIDENHIYVGLDGVGVIIVGKDLEVLDSYEEDGDNPQSLNSNSVTDILVDDNKILWISTFGRGVNKFDPNRNRFRNIQHVPHNSQSLKHNFVNAIAEDDSGRIWFASAKGFSILYNGVWSHIPENEEGQDYNVLDLVNFNGYLWAATYGAGLLRINPKTKDIIRYTSQSKDDKKISSNYRYAVEVDSKGRIWTGGIWGGISIIDDVNKTIQTVDVLNVRSLMSWRDYMFVGTVSGLYKVDCNSLEATRITNHRLLSNGRIVCLAKSTDCDSLLLLGTDQDGLLEWKVGSDSLTQKTHKDGLASGYVKSIIGVGDKIWISTTKGLSAIDRSDNITNYSTNDGISSIDFGENAIEMLSDGELLFGGSNGATGFYPEEINPSKQKVRPILREIKLNGNKLSVSSEGPLYENILVQEGLRLKHSENNIAISFGAIAYTSPRKIRFAWRLDGVDEEWASSFYNNEVIYSNLSPGKYVYHLKVSNDDGVWQDEELSFNIYVDNPFWFTIYAYVLYALVIAIIVVFILKWINYVYERKHYIDKQNFFVSIAHELKTPLSLIKLPIDRIQVNGTTPANQTEFIAIKRNVDRLINLTNQLLDFQSFDDLKVNIKASMCNIVSMISDTVDLFMPLAIEKGIKISTNISDDMIVLSADRSMLEKVFYNLVSNAIKYSKQGGSIQISASVSDKNCTIKVHDTGIGIPNIEQNKIFTHFFRSRNAINSNVSGSGLGLAVTKHIIELHGGNINFVSKEGEGTTFEINIPVKKGSEDVVMTAKFDNEVNVKKDSISTPEFTILIVDDNIEMLDNLSEDLFDEYIVEVASDGVEGVEKAKELSPDIIISDVMMPRMNGFKLCELLKENYSTSHIPIVLLTALNNQDFKIEGYDLGADAYIEKPFDMSTLKSRIRAILRNRELVKMRYTDVKKNADEDAFIKKLREYILENIDNNDLNIEATTLEMGMSRPTLYRKIKQKVNMSPQQFVINIRLNEASRLIKEGSLNVSEVAYAVGFTNPKYFSKSFKKFFGTTPTEYAKK